MLWHFIEHIGAKKRCFWQFSKSVVNFQNNRIFKIAYNLSTNKNQTFSSESWFGAQKDPVLIEIEWRRLFKNRFIPKIMILQFLTQTVTHAWQVISVCCKVMLMNRQNSQMFSILLFSPQEWKTSIYAFSCVHTIYFTYKFSAYLMKILSVYVCMYVGR